MMWAAFWRPRRRFLGRSESTFAGCVKTVRIPLALLLMVLAALLRVGATPAASASWTAVDLGTLGGGWSTAGDINDDGQVAGVSTTSSGEYHPFLWQDGEMKDLGTLGGPYSEVADINNRGQVIGWSYTADFSPHGFIWDDGVMTDLWPAAQYQTTHPLAINERGQVVGYRWMPLAGGGEEMRAFLWQNGVMTDLTSPGTGGNASGAVAINERGQVVGFYTPEPYSDYHAFRWQNGTLIDLGTIGGGIYSSAGAINQRGEIIGTGRTSTDESASFLWRSGVLTELVGFEAVALNEQGQIAGARTTAAGERRAFLRQRNGVLIDLRPTGGQSSAASINDVGQIAGNTIEPYWADQRPFVWQGGVATELDTLGRGYAAAWAINNDGQVVGDIEASGELHAVLWQPGS